MRRQNPANADDVPAPSRGARLLWAALAFCGSLLLLATTSQMCQEIAVFPFLWILPLALYLLSFVLTFELTRVPWRPIASLFFVASLPPVCYVLFKGATIAMSAQLGALSAALFAGCLVCHGELYRLRPSPRHLTTFYLLIAGGGALGGVFASLVAPVLFHGYWEYQLSLVLTALMLLVVLGREEGSSSGAISSRSSRDLQLSGGSSSPSASRSATPSTTPRRASGTSTACFGSRKSFRKTRRGTSGP